MAGEPFDNGENDAAVRVVSSSTGECLGHERGDTGNGEQPRSDDGRGLAAGASSAGRSEQSAFDDQRDNKDNCERRFDNR